MSFIKSNNEIGNNIFDEKVANASADVFIKYFSQLNSIEDYLRYVKRESVSELNSIFSLEDEFFNEDMDPLDMEFEIINVGHGGISQEHYKSLLWAVSSLNNEQNIPGRELKWLIVEKNTKKIVGFIRFGSPIINSKPRNLWVGQNPDLKIFNQHAAMGFVIVPSQPFGYNYLGGKLLALICTSHFARKKINDAFKKNICLFETTSLYGSTTSCSMYDGLKPFVRFIGLTESKFIPLLHDKQFNKLHRDFTNANNGNPLTDNSASSKKLKRQNRMISIIRNSLTDKEKLEKFNNAIDKAFSITEQKRFYISDYGFSNVKEVLKGEETELKPGQNYHKHELDYIISWWKKKASKRYNKLKSEGRFRTKVELWTETSDIQIIR